MAYTWNQGISSDTKITAAGIIELRNNVNAERTRRAKGAYSFSAEIVSGNKILRSAIEEIRTAAIGIRTDGGYVPPVLPNVDSFLVNNWVSGMRNDLNVLNDTGQSVSYAPGAWTGWMVTDSDPWYYWFPSASNNQSNIAWTVAVQFTTSLHATSAIHGEYTYEKGAFWKNYLGYSTIPLYYIRRRVTSVPTYFWP